jgi:hypothetical protein
MEDDVTKDLAEFSLANAIYAALIEGHACEISSRYAVTSVVPLLYFNHLCFPVAMPWIMRKRTRVT